MIIQSLTFYNVDFDIYNNNVIDFINEENLTDIGIIDFLKYKYPNSSILNSFSRQNRGINLDSNKRFTITLTSNEFNTVKNDINYVNYVVVELANGYLYAFIESYSETGNEIYILNCKYDIWLNNLKDINNHQFIQTYNNENDISKNYGTVETGHFVSYFKQNDTSALPIDYKLFYDKPKNKIEYISQPIAKYLGDRNYNILFLKIICTEELSINYGTAESPNIIKVPSNVGSLPIYYIPIGLRNVETQTYTNFKINYKIDFLTNEIDIYNSIRVNNNVPFIKSILNNESFKQISSYIISAELTFNTPIDYELAIEDDSIVAKFSNRVMSVTGRQIIAPVNDLLIVTPKITNQEMPNKFIERNLQVNSSRQISELKTNNRIKFIDSIFNVFPYNYKVIQVGNNVKVLSSPSPKYDRAYQLYKLDTDTLGLKIIYYNSKNTNEQFVEDKDFIRQIDGKEVSFSRDSLQYYLNTKGSQARNGIFNSILSSGVQALSGALTLNPNAISALATPFQTIRQYQALLTDAENSPNEVIKNNYRGEIDFDYLDIPLLIKYTFDDNDLNILQLENNIHYYGYNYNIIRNPFTITKRYFDYVRMSNVFLTIGDTYDRMELIKLFNRGFTRNHIKFDFDTGTFLNDTITNKNINNYDMWLEEEN